MRIALLLLFGTTLAAQKPGSIEGAVINSVTREPVKRAMVRLEGQNSSGSAVTSDDAGKYQFANVAPGKYVVSAEAQGYTRKASQAATVADEQKVNVAAIALTPGGVISGKVVDVEGEPMPNVMVHALVYNYPQGVRKLTKAAYATTNDRGEFRISKLVARRYYLMADAPERKPEPKGRMHRQGPDEEYAATYYPNALEAAGAAGMSVAAGAETGGVDLRMQKVRLFHVRGRVMGLPGGVRGPAVTVGSCEADNDFTFTVNGSWGNAGMRLEGIEGNIVMGVASVGNAPLAADGSFDVAHVAPGAHCVTAQGNADGPASFARLEIRVSDKDLENVALGLAAPFELRGSVVVEGTLPEPLQNVQLMMHPSTDLWGWTNTVVRPDGSFVAPNIAPLTYDVGLQLPDYLYVKTVRLGSQESTDGRLQVTAAEPLTIVVATDAGQVASTVKSANGEPVSCMVAIVPAGTPFRMDRFKNATSQPDGKFSLAGVPPGDYQVFAVDELEMTAIASPEYRQALAAKIATVTVHPNGRETVELTLIPLEETLSALERVQ